MTTQTKPLTERIKTAWAALCHGGVTSESVAANPPLPPVTQDRQEQNQAEEISVGEDPRIRIATLEMDLRDRDAEIGRLRQEYDRLREQAVRQQSEAATGGLEALARRLAPLLSQLATMQALAGAGRPLRAEDILALFGQVEQRLTEAGLTRVGTVGAEEPFDTRHHQRMSGCDVRDGDPVTVRFVGYRLGEKVLLKAMVSRQGGATAPDTEQ